MTGPPPRLLDLPEDVDEHEALFAAGLTDGLPVVAPTPERVEAMVAAGPWDPAAVLLHEPTRDLSVTAHQVATCAVLAGATPLSFPVIGAAAEAVGDPEFRLLGPLASTGGAALMVIVSGPVADTAGVNGRDGALGPGFRANATIGRAVRLVGAHCLLARPGQPDRPTQGWPGMFTLCVAENVDASPWPPLSTALGAGPGDSLVTVFAAGSGHGITNHAAAHAEPLLLTVADAMAGLGSFNPGRSVVVLAPEHAALLAGWDRPTVQRHLYDRAVRDLATLKRAGKIEHRPEVEAHVDWGGEWIPAGDATLRPGDDDVLVHRGWSPDDILLLVAGGAAGGHSAFFPSWSRGRGVAFVSRTVPV